MTDRHLSRGKRLDNGEWATGSLLIKDYNAWIINDSVKVRQVMCDIKITSKPIPIDPATIGRCTGLPDKNRKLIFEGDVCKDSLSWVFEVVWDKKNARFIGRHSKPRGQTYICYVGREPPVEILGNVFDNPELLTQED